MIQIELKWQYFYLRKNVLELLRPCLWDSRARHEKASILGDYFKVICVSYWSFCVSLQLFCIYLCPFCIFLLSFCFSLWWFRVLSFCLFAAIFASLFSSLCLAFVCGHFSFLFGHYIFFQSGCLVVILHHFVFVLSIISCHFVVRACFSRCLFLHFFSPFPDCFVSSLSFCMSLRLFCLSAVVLCGHLPPSVDV